MDTNTFWQLIERTRGAGTVGSTKQTELLTDEFMKLSEQELNDFEDVFDDLMREAYLADLWEVAYIIGRGCGDDGFIDFREWLISQGREIYHRALADPESLVYTDEIEIWFEEKYDSTIGSVGIGSALYDAWERKGLDFDSTIRNPGVSQPHSQLNRELRDEAQILVAFPKATAKFWKRGPY